jgi:DNA-binding transcriptional LysR family regulator
MSSPDLNLLYTLNAVLSEGSVARAARRLRLSPSAMSRSLARLRHTTGDPLLVRAGRGLVPTPRAVELRERVAQLVQDAEAVLRPTRAPNLAEVVRTFTAHTGEGFVENFGPALVERVAGEAPGVRLRFLPKTGSDNSGLRDGVVDLETGVIGSESHPELRKLALFRDRFVGVVRAGHALTRGRMTPARYAAAGHVAVSRRGRDQGRIDEALEALGLQRRIVTVVGGFSTALALARALDVIATVPERHTGNLRQGMHTFPLPFPIPPVTVSMLWHPRMHADPLHQWLRSCIRDVCAVTSTAR